MHKINIKYPVKIYLRRVKRDFRFYKFILLKTILIYSRKYFNNNFKK